MKKTRVLFLLTALLQFSFAGCFSDRKNNASDPLNNGSSQRNEIIVISDLHIGADLSYSELNTNIKTLEKFLNNVRVSPNVKELVIAGDLLDEWFVPADVNTYNGKDQRDFVKRISETNKGVVDSFNSIIKDGNIKVTYVPGNHDLTFTPENIDLILPGINQARDKELGLGTYSPDDFPQLAIEHGHRYNIFCAPDMISNQDIAPGTILPPGYFFTRIAALHVKQKCKQNIDVIKTITPDNKGDESQQLLYAYWQIWKWSMGMLPVNNYFNEKLIITDVNGFKGTYSINDLFPFQNNPGGEIRVNLFNNIQNSWDLRQKNNHVSVNIPVAHAIAYASSAEELDNTAFTQYLSNPGSDKRIVVFGHNHRATIIPSFNSKGQKSIYANSGTWIDKNPAGSTATFIIITQQDDDPSSLTKVEAYNFENEIYTQMALNTVRL